MFILNNFFEKSRVFWGNRKKPFWRRIWPFFKERGLLRQKINITFFNDEIGKSCFIIEQVFRKKQYFGRKLRRTHLWEDMTVLRGGGTWRQKQCNLFCRHRRFEYLLSNNFFEKNNIFQNIISKFTNLSFPHN